MTLKEAAAYLKCSERTLLRMIYRGLRHARTNGETGHYRFRKEWLDSYVEPEPRARVAKIDRRIRLLNPRPIRKRKKKAPA